MPHLMHSFYLRNMYQKNLLRQPGALTFGGQPIDLLKVKTPIFIQASKEDHIAPFKSVFKNTQLFSGPTELMLAGSGHIAGVINHPDANKYQYWTNTKKKKKYETAEEWFADAKEHPGSWWPYWDKWLSKKSGPKVPARDPAKGKLKPIEDAPGSYVKVKAKPYTGDGGGGE
jgi:polyhydroxyalkanoate synthase